MALGHEFDDFVDPIPSLIPSHADIMRAIRSLVDSLARVESILTDQTAATRAIQDEQSKQRKLIGQLIKWKQSIKAVSDQ